MVEKLGDANLDRLLNNAPPSFLHPLGPGGGLLREPEIRAVVSAACPFLSLPPQTSPTSQMPPGARN